LGEVNGKDVLEIGCGGGQNAIVPAKWGARSVCLDMSEERIRYGRELAREEVDTSQKDRNAAAIFFAVLSMWKGRPQRPRLTQRRSFGLSYDFVS